MPNGYLLPIWLEDAAKDRRTRARKAQHRRDYMKDDTPYRRTLDGIVEAHEEAAMVYERRLRELKVTSG